MTTTKDKNKENVESAFYCTDPDDAPAAVVLINSLQKTMKEVPTFGDNLKQKKI